MRLIVLLLVTMGLVATAGEDGERERLRAELPRLARDLADTNQLALSALQRLNLAPPPALLKAVEARQAALKDLQQAVADAARPLTAAQTEQVREDTQALRKRIGEVYTLADAASGAVRHWPQSAGTPELARYVAFVRAQLDGVLGELAGTGRRSDEKAYSHLRRRHEAVLGAVEAGRAAPERFRRVAADTPVLRDYLQQLQAVRTLAENGLEQPADWADDRELDRQSNLLSLCGERVALVQGREERLAERKLPADAPAVVALKACQAAEDEVLQAQIAHLRAPANDEKAWSQKGSELYQLKQSTGRMTGFAWEWVGMADEMRGDQQDLERRLRDTPPAVREEVAAALARLDQQRAGAEQALAKALAARALLDATQAKGELQGLMRSYDQLGEDLSLRLRLAEQEREFRTQAATATAALKRLAAARAAYLAARDQLREQEQAAIRARLARELAELAAEEAQKAVERSRGTVSALRDELDRVRQAAEAEQAAKPATAQAAADPGF
jgi:hypothetical protein